MANDYKTAALNEKKKSATKKRRNRTSEWQKKAALHAKRFTIKP